MQDRMSTVSNVRRRDFRALSLSGGAGRALRLVAVTGVALVAANCSQQQKIGRMIDPKYGVSPSPRVVEEGQPVPKGGGRDHVGKAYVIAGKTYVPQENPRRASEGFASWYGTDFHGRLTANGEIFDRHSIAAAHTTMPLPSYARVTNLLNGRSIIVRVNDRGPFHANRIMDVSQRTAEALDFARRGTTRVRVEYVSRASLNGSDDRMLLATLRTDGTPASLQGAAPVMVAEATPRPDAPQTAISFQRSPAAASERPGLAPAGLPLAAVGGRGVPLPPERPFDLGTIPSAATSVAASRPVTAMLPPRRPAAFAGLY
jgi:rare lipoprotein A